MPKDIGRWVGSAFATLPTENAVLSELLILAAGGHDYDKALYDRPTEKMMAQIQAATDVALEFPDEFPPLYAFLTTADLSFKTLKEETQKTLSASRAEVANAAQPGSDADLWQKGKDGVRARAVVSRTEASADGEAHAIEHGGARLRACLRLALGACSP